MTGADLAAILATLSSEWERFGPDKAYEAVRALDRETLEHLVMANAGARAIQHG